MRCLFEGDARTDEWMFMLSGFGSNERVYRAVMAADQSSWKWWAEHAVAVVAAGGGLAAWLRYCDPPKPMACWDVTGPWQVTQTNGMQSRLVLEQRSSGAVAGTATNNNKGRGTVTGRVGSESIALTIAWEDGVTGSYAARISAEGRMEGKTDNVAHQGSAAFIATGAPRRISCD